MNQLPNSRFKQMKTIYWQIWKALYLGSWLVSWLVGCLLQRWVIPPFSREETDDTENTADTYDTDDTDDTDYTDDTGIGWDMLE